MMTKETREAHAMLALLLATEGGTCGHENVEFTHESHIAFVRCLDCGYDQKG